MAGKKVPKRRQLALGLFAAASSYAFVLVRLSRCQGGTHNSVPNGARHQDSGSAVGAPQAALVGERARRDEGEPPEGDRVAGGTEAVVDPHNYLYGNVGVEDGSTSTSVKDVAERSSTDSSTSEEEHEGSGEEQRGAAGKQWPEVLPNAGRSAGAVCALPPTQDV